ncbi:hypothetical protein L207DRAFT_574917 [Hyaloscypha variabilis F]|uniref:Amidohydrolase-related domain-containing protein n=1 Tax=Hyaloscypha variabilis (strain UAMH 11265 / GT02V1 / F) TaxID=1149755 RepID=A0A2J6SBT6_HYAVF|nr:hypothetical protein L207DRAFT_574917 [Hyaloscypha variabilis F]
MKHLIPFLLTLAPQAAIACFGHGNLEPRDIDLPLQLKRRTTPSPSAGKTFIQNVRIFDGHVITPPTSLYIDGEVISKPFKITPSTNVRYINAGNRIMIPGLIDAHIHIPDIEGQENITSWGVTTAMNMACWNYTLCSYQRTYPQTSEGAGIASLFYAGLGAAGNGNLHSRLFQVPADELVYPDTSATQLFQMVDYVFSNWSDYYKICAKEFGPSQEQQTAIAAETHRRGYPVMTHASAMLAFEQAIPTLTDGLQHIPDDAILTYEMISNIRANGQFVTPTMNLYKIALANPQAAELLRGYLPTNETYAAVIENVALLHQAGIPVLAGTDSVGPYIANDPNAPNPLGLSLHYELENLVEAGFTPAEALRAATSLSAQMHLLQDRGVIAPGFRADLVLLDADPLVNISNTQQIVMVMVAGVEYSGLDNSL